MNFPIFYFLELLEYFSFEKVLGQLAQPYWGEYEW
jgi:hypothetical protein